MIKTIFTCGGWDRVAFYCNGGKRILIDPYLSDSLTKKYAATGKPHVRMSECVMDPEVLKNISVVTSSHNHTDHLDAETLIPVLKNNHGIKFIIPEANRDLLRKSEMQKGISNWIE
jgi:Predicted Zn-dependent hydrolases of the beta-lactamase fold